MRTRRYRGDEAVLAGLHPAAVAARREADREGPATLPPAALDRADTASRVASTLHLQRTAGNAATASLVGAGAAGAGPAPGNRPAGRQPVFLGHAARWKELDPPGAVKTIRSHMKPGGALGHTVAMFDDRPPLFATAGTEKVAAGHVAKLRRASSGPPDHEVEIPKPGRHHLRDLGENARQFLEITPEWAGKIRVGEQEHVDDAVLAWRLTWKAIVDAIAEVAKEPPKPAATPKAAEEAAWAAVRKRLPAWLRPASGSESDQRAAWEIRKGTPVNALVTATGRLRDDRGWHSPQASMDHEEGKDRIDTLDTGRSRIGSVKPEALIEEAIKALPRR